MFGFGATNEGCENFRIFPRIPATFGSGQGFPHGKTHQIMKRTPHQTDESFENDRVWELLDQSPPAAPTAHFTSDTVRLARLEGQPEPWWKKLISPAPIAGLATATAAVALAVVLLTGPQNDPAPVVDYTSPQAETIQDIAETEMLIAASDNLQEFSDEELICLIGF